MPQAPIDAFAAGGLDSILQALRAHRQMKIRITRRSGGLGIESATDGTSWQPKRWPFLLSFPRMFRESMLLLSEALFAVRRLYVRCFVPRGVWWMMGSPLRTLEKLGIGR